MEEMIMKIMKKTMAMVLSIVMMLAMYVTASAAGKDSYTITAPSSNHTYEIYQIFTGDLSDGILSNVKWGENGTGTKNDEVSDTVLEALAEVDGKTDSEKLAVITQYANLNSTPVATISNGQTYNAPAGYYLVKDKDGSVTGTDVYTTYIVMLSKDTTIAPKSDVPSFDKKVKDTNDSTGVTSDWQDSADYDIGDEVPFKLEGKITDKYDDYKTYYLAFHDKEEEGLTFNASSVKVFVDGNQITSGFEVVTSPTDGCTFEVVFSDLKQIGSVNAGSKISVEYTSTLNNEAALGKPGNLNQAKMEFSNNPNEEQGGNPETGETPWDNVIVFTYQVVVNKVDNESNALAGAEFTLKKVLENGTEEDIEVVTSNGGTSFTFKGLDDGNYILTETKTPDGYNTIKPIKFTVTANHEIEWDGENRNDVLTSLTGTVTEGTITFTANEDMSELAANVVNKKGIVLPGTGGIGTTIFYVIGGILMLGAAVTFVTRKRMTISK